MPRRPEARRRTARPGARRAGGASGVRSITASPFHGAARHIACASPAPRCDTSVETGASRGVSRRRRRHTSPATRGRSRHVVGGSQRSADYSGFMPMQASQLSGEQGAGHEPQTGARAGPEPRGRKPFVSGSRAVILPSGSGTSACCSAHRRSGADRCRRRRGLRPPASRHLRRGARVSATRGPRACQGQPVQLLPPGQPRMDDAGLRDTRRRFARSASRPAARGRSRRAVRPARLRRIALAHRGLGVPTTVDTQFAHRQRLKGLTALAVMSLVESGQLELRRRPGRCSAPTCR